ncbi:MAG: hypothetical protein KA354_07400 [Phycisphaerae bacterium]|nr:hypothetical protein [Phycisphaerae bacterium]
MSGSVHVWHVLLEQALLGTDKYVRKGVQGGSSERRAVAARSRRGDRVATGEFNDIFVDEARAITKENTEDILR